MVAEAGGRRDDDYHGIPGLDTSVAHPARVYDYWLGGKDNFAADREAAERVLAVTPGLRFRIRANRGFLIRSVRFLAGPAGVRQFLDVGTGIPAADNTHEVAQQAAPDSRIVYVDNDPMVMLHAKALLRSSQQGTTRYIQADLRDPELITEQAWEVLDYKQPIAVLLLGILHLVQDSEDPWRIVSTLMAPMPAGSYLVISHPGLDVRPGQMDTQRAYNERVSTPMTMRTRDEFARFFDGLEQIEPGIVQTHQWRPRPGDFSPDGVVSAYACVGRKPASRAV